MSKILTEVKKFFGLIPKTPNEFIKDFLKNSKKSYYDLILKYNDNFVLFVEPLKFTSVLFKASNKNINNFKDGYIVYFEIENDKISNSIYYKKFKGSLDLELFELGYVPSKKGKFLIARFFEKEIHYMELAIYLKEVLDRFNFEKNPNTFIDMSSKKYD